MTNQPLSSSNPRVDLEYRRKKNAEEMRHQVISFTLMIFLTFVAFAAVAVKGFTAWFIVPFILLLAAVQVVFQLFYFMHMSHKGHEAPSMFLFTGLFMGLVIVLAFMTIIWW
ncbi:cytochrome c oxidase subunit IVB [Neobacillus mesonae]|uniref:Cytochrome c oxidase subunit IVB n=1 Tax=Neobacillus mesonae TaxID=1193713 RepID=A0A3Q9QSX1_9BACI|nr:cytochrome c oxidase subunit IVB [Neobacillus mesonae]AZU61395.1 cytochrome c oxidase subunit IVB [Neobacillus mesonae]MED4203350.1 cytochrome c oxidase subunit IVB [Neobacillus mesonae]